MNKFSELINDSKPVLVDFFAEWCGPCKMMPSILKDVKSALGDQAKVLKIDVDKNPTLANVYGIQGVPTLVIFKDGKIKWRQSGVHQANELISLVKQYL